jgi:hypothetical protein
MPDRNRFPADSGEQMESAGASFVAMMKSISIMV